MATNFLRLRSSIGKMLRRHHRVYVSEVDRCNFRAYVSEVDHCNFRNSVPYFVRLLETKIQLVEAKVIRYETNPGRIHCGLVKTGIRTDQVLCKMLRLYGSWGSLVDAEKLFNESRAAGLGVWNAFISSLATNGEAVKAINVFENIPPRLRKTHSTYWNVLVACTHAGETNYAHYLLGRIFKILAIEPPIELMGTYIDGLARNGMLKEAVDVVKSLKVYKPNQEIVVSILTKYKDDPDPITFANDFVQYLEEQGVSFYIAEPTYRLLAEDGVKWRPNVKIQKQKKAVSFK